MARRGDGKRKKRSGRPVASTGGGAPATAPAGAGSTSPAAPPSSSGPPPATAPHPKSVWDRPWLLPERLRLPTLPEPWERIFGANGLLWIALLSVIPIIYVGFALTVSVTNLGLPRNLYPWIDNDYWWHLATGNWIVDRREMPTPDPFLFTYDGQFIAHEWLAEVFLTATDRVAGYALGIGVTWVIAIFGFWLLMLTARVYGLGWRWIFLLAVLWMGVFLRPGVFAVRPQMWTFSFYAVLFFALAMYQTGRWKQLWLLPPFFLIWFNTHLSAVIGIFCLAAFGLDQLIRDRQLNRHLLIVGLLSAGSILVNPFGLDFLDPIFTYQSRGDIWNERIFEWMPPDFDSRYNWPFALAMVMVVPAVWQLLRLRVWPAVPLLVMLWQALVSVRFVPVYVMLAIVFAGWLAWQHRQDRPLAAREPGPVLPRQPLLLVPVAVAFVAVLWVAATYEFSQFQEEPVAWGYPVEAATIYQEELADRRIFNVYDFGGYLDFRYDGDPQVYIDGRTEVYPPELLERYFSTIDADDGWEQRLVEDDIGVVLVRPFDGIATPLSQHPGWQLVYQDDFTVMFVRLPGVGG